MHLYEAVIPTNNPDPDEPKLSEFSKWLEKDGWVVIGTNIVVIDTDETRDRLTDAEKQNYRMWADRTRKKVANFLLGGEEKNKDQVFKTPARYLVAYSNGKPLAGKDSFFHKELSSVIKLLKSQGLTVESLTTSPADFALSSLKEGKSMREVIEALSENG